MLVRPERQLPLRSIRHKSRRHAAKVDRFRRVHEELARITSRSMNGASLTLEWSTTSEDGTARLIEALALSGEITQQDRARLLGLIAGLEHLEGGDSVAPVAVSADRQQFALGRWVPVHRDRHGVIVAVDTPPSESDAQRIDLALEGDLAGIVITDPDTLRKHIEQGYGADLAHEATELFNLAHPHQSAKQGLRLWQLLLPAAIVAAISFLYFWQPTSTLYGIWFVMFAAIGVNVAFKTFTAFMTITSKRGRAPSPRPRIEDDALPRYTVLVPLYDEANVAESIVRNLTGVDYPKHLLQVVLILEENDRATQRALSQAQLPQHFEVLIVPDGPIRTKPRACNYGLTFATGDYVVIYDAEDEPEIDQLRKAVDAFNSDSSGRLACVQARLHYYNARSNALTRLFALEYAFWFDTMLPGLQQARIPIPLGGTSNHFRTEALRTLGGWDAYNVTEDADLGMRIGAAGLRTDVLDSTTWEEACGRVWPWIKQRTRWIKGYILTAAVYTRSPIRLFRNAGLRGALSVFALILSTPIAFLVYPLVYVLPLAQLLGLVPVPEVAAALLACAYVLSGLTLLIVVGLTAYAGLRRYSGGLCTFAVLSPVYWFLHSIAAWRALWQSIRSPHTWEKTPHGLA